MQTILFHFFPLFTLFFSPFRKDAARLLAMICKGLQLMHRAGVANLDLSLENIFCHDFGTLEVLDLLYNNSNIE